MKETVKRKHWALRGNINKYIENTKHQPLYIKLYLCVKHIVDKIQIHLMNDIYRWRETKNGTEIIFIMLSRIKFIDYIFISSLSSSVFPPSYSTFSCHDIMAEFEGRYFSEMRIKQNYFWHGKSFPLFNDASIFLFLLNIMCYKKEKLMYVIQKWSFSLFCVFS